MTSFSTNHTVAHLQETRADVRPACKYLNFTNSITNHTLCDTYTELSDRVRVEPTLPGIVLPLAVIAVVGPVQVLCSAWAHDHVLNVCPTVGMQRRCAVCSASFLDGVIQTMLATVQMLSIIWWNLQVLTCMSHYTRAAARIIKFTKR